MRDWKPLPRSTNEKRPPRPGSTIDEDETDSTRLAWIDSSWIARICHVSYSNNMSTRRWNNRVSVENDAKVRTASNSGGRPTRIISTFSASEISEQEASINAHVFWIFTTYYLIERLPLLRECRSWWIQYNFAPVIAAKRRVAVFQTSHTVRASVNKGNSEWLIVDSNQEASNWSC